MSATLLSGETVLWRPTGGVEVHAGVVRGGRTPRVVLDHDLLLVLDCAEARLWCRRRLDAVFPTLLAVMDPGEVLAPEVAVPCAYRAVSLAPGLLAELGPRARSLAFRAGGSGRRLALLVAGGGFCEAVDEIDGEAALRRFVDQTLARGPGTVRLLADERMDHAVVARVRGYLLAGYARRITIEELGRVAGMCRYALVRAFTKEIGMPPHCYQTHLRVMRAAALVAAGRPLTDVALEVGFTDQSHLSRNFKRVLGVPPGRYARLHAGSPLAAASRPRRAA